MQDWLKEHELPRNWRTVEMYNNRQRGRKSRKRRCVYCFEDFKAVKHPNQKYCSRQCRNKMANARRGTK